MYEETDGGYAVRYYISSVNSIEKAEIPAEHNGKPVVSLRGNTFSKAAFTCLKWFFLMISTAIW